MPVLESSPRPPGTLARRARYRRSLLSILTRLLVVVAVFALLGGGWYMAKKGFGRQWRRLVVEELHKRGVEASIRRLTLDPFRGLIAQGVRIYDYKDREKTLGLISQVSLDINYAALLHHRPFLNAIDIRNAQISLPLEEGQAQTRKSQLKNFRAHVYFPPEQIYVSQAEGIFCGVRISVTGQLIKRDNYQPSPPLTQEEWELRLAILRRVVTELQKLSFPEGPPTLQIKFSGDLAQIENAHVEATLRGERLARGNYDIRDLFVSADWTDQTLNLPHCEWTDHAGVFAGRGNWSRKENRANFQAHCNIDAKSFLEAFGLGDSLAATTFEASPVIEISGDAELAGDQPQLKIIGHASAGSFSYRNVPLKDLNVDFSWNGEQFLLRDLRVRQKEGELTANLLSAPDDFRLDVRSSISPVAIRPLLPPESQTFLDQWEWQRPPAVDLAIRGSSRKPESWQGQGSLSFDRTRFRGIWMNSASAKIRFGDGAVTYDNIRLARNEGVATGTFTYDFKNHEVRVANIKSSLFPAEISSWIDPDLYKTVAPYKFRHPPNIRADGVYQFHGGKQTRLELLVDAPEGMDYVFLGKTLPFDRVSGKLTFTNDRLEIADLRAGLFSGNVRGAADISLARGDPRYQANIAVKSINFPRLTDLYYQYKTSQGELSGHYDFKGLGSDARSMQGNGRVEVTNGDVFAIPVFGPLSEILNVIVPGSGYSIARNASAAFTIKDGTIHTEDFETAGKLFSMLGHGDIHFLDDKLDFDIRMNASGPGLLLTPVYKLFEYTGEGSLKNPTWHPKRF